jgi:transcription initiation factor TFIIIB Brf1 subunit/transcription initiation factor TFIIB
MTRSKELKKAFITEKKLTEKDDILYYQAYVEVKRICDFLRLPKNFFDDTMVIYRTLKDRNFIKKFGNRKFATLAAIILVVCRKNQFPISFSDVFEITTEKPKTIIKIFQRILMELRIKLKRIDLRAYVIYHANELGLEFEERKKAILIAEKLTEKPLNGRLDGYSLAIIKQVTDFSYNDLQRKIGTCSTTVIGKRLREIRKVIKNEKI